MTQNAKEQPDHTLLRAYHLDALDILSEINDSSATEGLGEVEVLLDTGNRSDNNLMSYECARRLNLSPQPLDNPVKLVTFSSLFTYKCSEHAVIRLALPILHDGDETFNFNIELKCLLVEKLSHEIVLCNEIVNKYGLIDRQKTLNEEDAAAIAFLRMKNNPPDCTEADKHVDIAIQQTKGSTSVNSIKVVDEVPTTISEDVMKKIQECVAKGLPEQIREQIIEQLCKGYLHGVFSDSLIADRKLRNCGPTLHQPVQNWKGDGHRRHSARNVKIMRDFFEPLIKVGYVVPTDATSLSNVHVVHQTRLNPDGKTENTSKVTIDLRKVNDLSDTVKSGIPIFKDLAKRISGNAYYFSADMTKAYYQLPASEEHCYGRAFYVPGKGALMFN